jgi:RNA polymerase sigma-70 factor (ECF subfamily)
MSPRDLDDPEWLRRTLLRAVSRICPSRLASHREDIVQAAMLRIMETMGRREQSGIQTASYLWKAAYTATVDEIRRMERLHEVPLEEMPAELEAGRPAAAAGALDDRLELGTAIRGCLSGLLADRREAVALHLYGFSAQEVARMLGWDLKRTNNLLYRGLADLRDCLRTKGVHR